MIMLGLYLFFLTAFSAAGGIAGYFLDDSYPGSGSLIAVAAFVLGLWFSWVISLRILHRFWPEQPEQPTA